MPMRLDEVLSRNDKAIEQEAGSPTGKKGER